MKKIVFAFVCFSIFSVSTIIAGDYNYSLSPYVGYHFFGGERDLKDRPEFGIKVERFLKNDLGFQIGLGYVNTKSEINNSDANLLGYQLHLKKYFSDVNNFSPYVMGGLAGDITRGMNIGPSIGVGGTYKIKENLGIFGEIRDNYLFGDGNDVILALGLNFYLDKKKKALPAQVEKKPVDSDGDGVFDENDKCPNTPKGVKVDSVGCPLDSDKDGVYDYLDKCPDTPAGVKVDSVGCPLDSDKDDVYDYLDKCPGTPAGVKVDSVGCPLDSDNDGVYDSFDKCPNTPKGSTVDKDGCEVSISLLINFDTNKSIVKEEYYSEIEKVANFMKSYPNIKVEIAGHTDSRGNRENNIKLSQDRANAVMDILVNKYGIDKARVSAKGYGPDKPIDTNDTEAGRAKNRRVEAVIIR